LLLKTKSKCSFKFRENLLKKTRDDIKRELADYEGELKKYLETEIKIVS
jgi:hypothetical protein